MVKATILLREPGAFGWASEIEWDEGELLFPVLEAPIEIGCPWRWRELDELLGLPLQLEDRWRYLLQNQRHQTATWKTMFRGKSLELAETETECLFLAETETECLFLFGRDGDR